MSSITRSRHPLEGRAGRERERRRRRKRKKKKQSFIYDVYKT
jgi:hypothetical protein